jgi:hypothetical protein
MQQVQHDYRFPMEPDACSLQGAQAQAKREAHNSYPVYQMPSHNHRPSAYTLLLEEYDLDSIANDLYMNREELRSRLQVTRTCTSPPPANRSLLSFPLLGAQHMGRAAHTLVHTKRCK